MKARTPPIAAGAALVALLSVACGSERSTAPAIEGGRTGGAGGTNAGGASGTGGAGSGGSSGGSGGSSAAGRAGSGGAGSGGAAAGGAAGQGDGGPRCGGDPSGAPALRAADFLDTLGMNVHVEYTDGDYADVNAVIADLAYLGVRHVRDGNLDPGNQGQASYGVAADAGILFALHTGGDPVVAVQRIHDFVAAHPGSVVAIEGPNEVNNWPVTHEGLTGDAAAQAFQVDLYDAVEADALLRDIPVYGVTSWPEFASRCDVGNYHSYAHDGDQPFSWLEGGRDAQADVFPEPGPPMVLTETGYYTLPGGPGWEGVDDQAQAKFLLNTYFDAAHLGVVRTYVYQLLDAYPDPGGSDMEKHFGVFDIDNVPKAAARAIHNLTTILADGAAEAASFSVGALDHSIARFSGDVKSLLLQKADCSFAVAIWNEPDLWDEGANQAVAPPTENVTVTFGAAHASVAVYDPLQGTSPVQSLSNASEIQLVLTGHPLIVVVR